VDKRFITLQISFDALLFLLVVLIFVATCFIDI